MNDFEKIKIAKELIEKKAFVGAAIKGVGGYLLKNPLKSIGTALTAGDVLSSASGTAKRVGTTFTAGPSSTM